MEIHYEIYQKVQQQNGLKTDSIYSFLFVCLFFSIKSHWDVIKRGFVYAISFSSSSSMYRWLFLSFVYVEKKNSEETKIDTITILMRNRK
jgi:hypothetical protein